MSVVSVSSIFPPAWRFVASVERPGGRDEFGVPIPGTEHKVSDCLISTTASEDQVRSDSPDTTAWLYGPVGADFQANDRVTVPESPLWLNGVFVVTGRPSPTPLGVSVPLREVGSSE